MTTDALVSLLDERPFRPSTLHMPDRRHLAVSTAHFMSVRPDSTLVFL